MDVSEAEEEKTVVPNVSVVLVVVVVKLEVCLANDVLLLLIVPLRILIGTKARQVLKFDAAISEGQERSSFLFCILFGRSIVG